MSKLAFWSQKPLKERDWGPITEFFIRYQQHFIIVIMKSDQSQSHDDSRRSGYFEFESLTEQHKKGANPSKRKFARLLQLHSIQS